MGYSSEAVMVLSTAAAATVGEALARAGGRFYGVGEDGSERGRVAGEPEAPVVYEDELYTPNSVSGVLVGRRGPWMYVDCKSQISDAMRRRFIAVLVEELEAAGITEARLATPSEDDKHGGPLRELASIERAVVLCLYPPFTPQPRPVEPRAIGVPRHWIDEAGRWLGTGPPPVALAMVGSVFGASRFEPIETALGRLGSEGIGLVAAGDPGSRVRAVHASGGFPNLNPPNLALAAGGPGVDDAGLLVELEGLIAFARGLAADVRYAFAAIHVDFSGFTNKHHPPDWTCEGDGVNPVANPHMERLLGEIVLDGFPCQILGPGHVARLGELPPGAQHLGGGRVELAVGRPEDWLLEQDAYSRRAYPEKYTLSAYRRNRTVQEDARRILRRCLVTRSETFALLARRE